MKKADPSPLNGVLDFVRVHEVARAELADLLAFCDQLAARARF